MSKEEMVKTLLDLADTVKRIPKDKHGNNNGWDTRVEAQLPGLRGYLILLKRTAIGNDGS